MSSDNDSDNDTSRRDEARRLAREIGRQAIRSRKGTILPLRAAADTQDPPRPLNPHFHSGTTGIAYFLAALAHVARDREAGDLALALLELPRRQLRQILDDPDRAARAPFRLGAMIGLGGFLYSFVRVGRWLEEPSLIEEAHRISTLVTLERIRADGALDLAHGSAGALLALLHLHRVAPDANPNGDRPLELARACAEHLLRQRVSPSGAPRAWPYEYGETPLCGLAHGASGIACALLRLHRETGDPELLAAAHEGMAYERQHYTAPPGEWQDLRDPDTRRFTTAWCHGSPGIALARLEALEFGESEDENASDFADDLDKALATTRNPELDPVDHLCCGNAGRIEVLLSAHRSLQDVSLRTEAEALERKLRRRAEGSAEESEGRYRWSDEDPEAFVPGLMVGAAGLGYTLLRLEDETALPGVLLLR